MNQVDWKDYEEYIAAGNLMSVTINDDFETIELSILYAARISSDEKTELMDILIYCGGYHYFDMIRGQEHTSGSAIILEAYLYKESDLITAYMNNQLHTKVNAASEEPTATPQHLQLVGEIDINILCESIKVNASSIRYE